MPGLCLAGAAWTTDVAAKKWAQSKEVALTVPQVLIRYNLPPTAWGAEV